MEPHVKERIVGAAVLVALGVWLIPWVLDGPDETIDVPEAAAPGLTLQSPDEAAPRRTETIELQQSARRANASSADTPANDPLADSEPAQPAIAEPAPALVAARGQESDSDTTISSVDTPADTPAEPPAQVDGWSVQLGSFTDVANANQLASRVSSYGYSAVVSEFRSGSRTMHRVRVGGFNTENEADAAASSLSAHNITVQVIPPE